MAQRVQAQDAWSNDPSSVPGTHVKSLVGRCRAVTPEFLWKDERWTQEDPPEASRLTVSEKAMQQCT